MSIRRRLGTPGASTSKSRQRRLSSCCGVIAQHGAHAYIQSTDTKLRARSFSMTNTLEGACWGEQGEPALGRSCTRCRSFQEALIERLEKEPGKDITGLAQSTGYDVRPCLHSAQTGAPTESSEASSSQHSATLTFRHRDEAETSQIPTALRTLGDKAQVL